MEILKNGIANNKQIFEKNSQKLLTKNFLTI